MGAIHKVEGRNDMSSWMAFSPQELIDSFGEPLRKDPSPYAYETWIYADRTCYTQFGLTDVGIQMVYMTGEDTCHPILGKSFDDVSKRYDIVQTIRVENGSSEYHFHLTEEEIRERPLIALGEHLFMQLYFDIHEDNLLALRLLTLDVILEHIPYKIEYRGHFPEQRVISKEKWERIAYGVEQQIFELTNLMRRLFHKPRLEWENKVHEIALMHSHDMNEKKYFSHVSPDGKDLQDRLTMHGIHYEVAGENIAAKFPDAPAAMIGWLNSLGHREALLAEEFTHIGVGVSQTYYTQNYIKQ